MIILTLSDILIDEQSPDEDDRRAFGMLQSRNSGMISFNSSLLYVCHVIHYIPLQVIAAVTTNPEMVQLN